MSITTRSSEVSEAAPVAESWCFTEIKVIKFSYIWTISNFSYCGKKMISTTFSSGACNESKWYLELYPKGLDENNKHYLSLFLCLASCVKAEVQAKFKFSILDNEQNKRETKESDVKTYDLENSWGVEQIVHRNTLFDGAKKLLTGDKLTLCCELSVAIDSVNTPGQNTSHDFKIPECNPVIEQLLKNQRFSDFVFSVNGKKFFVHKCILASCSPVFAAMFEQEMAEKKDNRVKIIDMNAEVMEEMLRFMYTGKTPCLEKQSGKMVRALLVASDKYALDRLKLICEEALCSKLSVDTASDLLIVADSYNADQLKARVIDFIIHHATEVMATSGWKIMLMQHDQQVIQILAGDPTLRPVTLTQKRMLHMANGNSFVSRCLVRCKKIFGIRT